MLEDVNGSVCGMTPTDETVSLHGERMGSESMPPTSGMYAPDADKVNVDVDTERLLERIGLLPALVVVAREHFVGEWNLLVVTRRQEPDLPRLQAVRIIRERSMV